MPVSGLVNYEGAVTIFGQVAPHECKPFELLRAGSIEVAKLAILHCLPSDQAADLYVFEAVNNQDFLDQPPFDMFADRNRVCRVEQGCKIAHEIIMDDGRIVRFLLSHTPDARSLSLS